MNLTLRKLTVLAGFAMIAVLASGCSDAKKTPTPPPPPDGGGGNGPVSRRINRPDLRVTRFDAQVLPDGRVRMTAEVSNVGLASTGRPSTLSLRRIAEKGDIDEITTVEIPKLESGQSTVPIVKIVPAKRFKVSRSILLCAYADVRQEVKEGTDEEQNNHTDYEIVYGPDLVVREIVNPSPDDARKLQLVASLGNKGTLNADGFKAVWSYSVNEPNPAKDKKDEEIWKVFKSDSVASLPVKQRKPTLLRVDMSELANQLAGRTVTVRLALDRDGKVPELDNTNNASGIGHTFPPNDPDLNVWGLMTWWNRSEAKLHFHSFITNEGEGRVPNGKFNSQWFRLPGVNNGNAGGETFSSGTDNGWEALSDLLQHEEAETMRPWKLENWVKNPEFVYSPEVKEEGQVISLRYEVDPYNEIKEKSDPDLQAGPAGPAGAPRSEFSSQSPAKIGQKVRLGLNGPNNSFVWNFRIPEFIQPNLRIISVWPKLSDDRSSVFVRVWIANDGNQGTGKYRVIAGLDGKEQNYSDDNLAPTGWLREVPFRFEFTQAQKRAGKATLAVRLELARKNRTQDAMTAQRQIDVPEGKLAANVFMQSSSISLTKERRDETKPDQYDTLAVRYRVVNSGDKPSGKFRVTITVEGAPGEVHTNNDGIAPGQSYPQDTLIDIRPAMRPDRAVPVKVTIAVDAENDRDKSDNVHTYEKFMLPATGPAIIPADLVVTDIRGASATNQTVGKYRMLATIANIGQGPAPDCEVAWWVNDHGVSSGGCPALQPGQAAVGWIYSDIPLPAGATKENPAELDVTVFADTEGIVHDSNRRNNHLTVHTKTNEFYDGLDPLPRKMPVPPNKEKNPDVPNS